LKPDAVGGGASLSLMKRFLRNRGPLRMASTIALVFFVIFLFIAISNPGDQGAMRWMQVSFSIALVTLIINAVFKRREKVQKGMDAVNSIIPIMAGGMVAMIGLIGLLSSLLNADALFGAWLGGGTGVLFLTIGIEICIITIVALRSGKQTWNLMISLGLCLVIDLVVSWLLQWLFSLDFFNSITFLLIAKAAVMGLLVALGLRLDLGKDYTVERTFSFFTNSIFAGVVFLVIILAVIVPASYLLSYSGAEQFSSIISVQNPLFEELVSETGTAAGASGDFLMRVARALSPVDFQTLTIDLSALGVVASTFWTAVLGLGMTGAGGLEITGAQILVTELFLVILFGIALKVAPESAVTFKALDEMGAAGWVDRIVRKMYLWKRKKKVVEGTEEESGGESSATDVVNIGPLFNGPDDDGGE
jgi:hypothetical protein